MLEGNRLLEALSASCQSLIRPFLTDVRLARDQILFEAGDRITHCYFPLAAASASYFVMVDDDGSIEAAMVGAEGCLGGVISTGQFPAYTRGIVVQPGEFFRISCGDLASLARNSPELEGLLRRYADCLLAELLQTIACSISH